MNESLRRALQTVGAVAGVVILVAALSAIATVRADNREPDLVAAGDGGSGGTTGGPAGGTATGTGTGGASTTTAPVDGQAPAPGAEGGAPAPGAEGGAPGAAPAGGAAPAPGQGPAPAGGEGGGCADYNPNEGVYCDRFLIGGTTILSGPLAIYGEAGLRGGQAWIQYFRTTLAPALGVRSAQLVYYDDNLDPNKTLQFTQRMVEVDKVLLIGGVTSPGAIAAYLEEKGVPFIGDLGLNPESYTSPNIFPTAAPFEVSFALRTKLAYSKGARSMYVIQDVLPGVNPNIYKADWEQAAERIGVRLLGYTSIASDSNSCDSKMLEALRSRPQWIMLPVAAPPMLGCMREAATQQAGPGKPVSSQLINWSGGSNLQFEVDQCGGQCNGMFSAGTPFLDPRSNPSEAAKTYLANMAKYAPGIDVTGFIPINYYHAGLLQFEVMKQGGILKNLSRKNVLEAADGFGPFETGFGNTVQWAAGQVPRVPTTCGYSVVLDGRAKKWVFQNEKICL